MFLVFFGHAVERLHLVSGAPGALEQMRVVYAFHMPLFFLLAGLFFRPVEAGFGRFLVHKLKTRIVPVGFFALLALPFWFVTERGISEPGGRALAYLAGNPVLNWPSWFLVCLFVVEVSAGLLEKCLPGGHRRRLAVLIPVAILLGSLTGHFGSQFGGWAGIRPDFWYWQEAVIAAPFYLVGMGLAGLLKRPPQPRRLVAVAGVGLGFLVVTAGLNREVTGDGAGVVNMVRSQHGHMAWFYATALAGSVGLLAACALAPAGGRMIRFVGSNTLIYLGLAGIAMHFIDGPLLGSLPRPPESGIETVLVAAGYAAGLMAFFAPTVWAIRHWMGSFVGIRRRHRREPELAAAPAAMRRA